MNKMATYTMLANLCPRHRLREFRIFPIHYISNYRHEKCWKSRGKALIHACISKPQARFLFLRFANIAVGPHVTPNVRLLCPSPLHRFYCEVGIRNVTGNDRTVHSLIQLTANLKIRPHGHGRNYTASTPNATSQSQIQNASFTGQRCQLKRNRPIQQNHYSKGCRSHEMSPGFCIASAFALLFFNFKKEEEDSIELFVAKAVSAEKRGQMGEAANFYHQAITLAQQENKKDKVAFIYDMMANFYLRIDENFKAEKLFKETIKLLLECGFEQYDPAVLEISLKLASIYELQFRYTEAEAGYRFCVSKSEEGLESYKKSGEKDSDKEMNLYAMLGVSLDAYGKFMLKQNHLDEAEKAYLRAIKICENELADEGKPHPQTATLLNDLGTVYEQKKNYTKAMETICRAEELAKDSKDDLAIILCNKASLHLRNGNREDATSLFRQALRLAERSQDEETIRFVKIAMSKLAAPLKKGS